MTRVLLIVHNNTYFAGLALVGEILKRQGKYEPLILFVKDYPTLQSDINICLKENFSYILAPDLVISKGNGTAPSSTKKTLLTIISGIRIITRFFLKKMPINVVYHLYIMKRELTIIRQLICKNRISMIILPADNRYDQAVYIKAGHIEHIPSVVIPQWMAGSKEWAEFVWDEPDYNAQKWSNRLAGKLYPHWLIEHNGRALIARPANEVLVYEWLGIAPSLPWILHSGFADAIALENEAVRDYCISEGISNEQLVITGSCILDKIAGIGFDLHKKKSELCTALKLPPDLPVILSALPPDSIYMGRPDCEFQNYKDLLEFWCRSLAFVKGYNIIICLHPSVKPEDMRFIEKWGVKIAKEPTYQLIPLCDLFVASVSATIQWAIACGKPVLNYDVYQYHYTDYNKVSGVITVKTKTDFLNTLHRLTTESELFTEISARQLSDAEQWGRLDGKSGERLIQLFNKVIDKYTVEKAK